MARVTPHHEFRDHTGEVRLSVEAPTLAGLFEEAARGFSELVAEATSETDVEERRVSLRARDREALLVAWLNELVFLTETRGRVYTDVRVSHVTDTALEASVRGGVPKALRTAVKAATLHRLKVRQSPHGFTASVVLDV